MNAQSFITNSFNLFNPSVVSIHTGKGESGSGFVFAEYDGRLLIVTANHVVQDAGKIEVGFLNYQLNRVGDPLAKNEFYDVAVVAVIKPEGFKWRPVPYVETVRAGLPVFCIGVRRNRVVLNRNNTAIIKSLDSDEFDSSVNIDEGDSGTPLLSDHGIVGMIVKQPGKALTISLIRDLVNGWDYPWDLTPAELPKPQKEQVEFISKEVRIPISKVSDLNGGIFKQLHDYNLGTHVTFNHKSNTLKIQFDEEKAFNKIRIFCPANKDGDVPSGAFIYLPGEDNPIRMNRIRNPVMKRYGNGFWVIYDLKKNYTHSEFGISFNLLTDSNSKPIAYSLYDIEVFGPDKR